MCTGRSGWLPHLVKGKLALHKGEGGSIYLKILEKSTQNNDEDLAQECETCSNKCLSRTVFRFISSAVDLEGKM